MSAAEPAGGASRRPRYLVRLPVEYVVDAEVCRGEMVEVSGNGARISGPEPEVGLGAEVLLDLLVLRAPEPVLLAGRVVRKAAGEFAVEFVDDEPFLRAVLALARYAPKLDEAERASRRARLLKQLTEL